MLVEQLSQQGNVIEYRVCATSDEFADAARHGVRAFLLEAGAPIPDDDQMDQILAQIIGSESSVDEAKRDMAAHYLAPRAVQQAHVMPVCSPDITCVECSGDADEFEMHLTVCSKPELELTDYGPVAIEVDAPQVSEEEIDERVRELVIQYQDAPASSDTESDAPEKSSDPLAQVDDAWVAEHIPDDAVQTVEQMRQAIRSAGEQQKLADFENYKTAVATAQMSERLRDDVPSDIVNAMAKSMMDELRAQAQNAGVAVDEMLMRYGMNEQDMAKRAQQEAHDMLRQGLTLDAVFRHEGLSIEEQDRNAALHAIAPGAEEDAAEQLAESGYMFTVEETAQRLRAGRWILEHAQVTIRA